MEFTLRIHLFTAFVSCIKVYAQVVQPVKHPGLQVLATASHYWPLDAVDGIQELWDQIGNRPGYVNGSNINIVEGMVNKGIFLNGDNGGTFLHFGSYQNSCISDPTLCGPEGITFSFFWKNHEVESRFAVASGGKVISNGFSVYTNPLGGYVEFYTRGNNHRWKAKIPVPGPYWTHILFSWKKTDGLNVYINGTFSANDVTGSVSDSYGDPHPDLVIGTGNNRDYGHYVTGAFDEFVIWERALSPEEILLYYNAAIGQAIVSALTPTVSKEITSATPTVRTTVVGFPAISSQQEKLQELVSMPVSTILKTLTNGTIPHNYAINLTQAFLKSLEEILSLGGLPEQSTPMVSGLIKTVDRVMEHMVTNLEPSPHSSITLGGTSVVADYSMVRIPQNFNFPHYRFPTQGKNYISVPGEAFTVQCQTSIVGLFYHSMHSYYKEISPMKTKINEAADFMDHKIQVASNLISLKVEPSPALSLNLSGAPLIKIVLTHVLTKEQQDRIQNESNRVFLYCAFLNYSSNEAVWSNEGCVRSEGNMTYSVCLCNHLTNFAILMQVVPLKLSTVHKVALSTIGYVGCSISIFCLAITLVTFAVLSSVSTIRNQRYHIHANLSFAILVAEMLLLISARFDPDTLPCKIMAVLLHFFFLSAFAWMLVEGLHLYSMVVKVFGSENSKHIYYYGIGWGCPLLICVVSITSALDSYGKVDNCWLSLKNGAIWAFVAPALFVIVVNIGILISVTRIISRISGENYKVHGDANAVKLTAKAVAVLLPILGISWIFGVLAVNTNSLPFLYIFAIFNSLQGFFVFLFHCLLNSEVRAAFKHKTKVWSLTSSSIRNINVKPFNSDIMNGNKEDVTPTKMNTWEKSTNSANRIDLSAV
ncbi:adhesion G-protein coupled receptor D1 isoform X2 [Anabas testudineus]|uniref:Adhesion G protein-coupled receptor D1 n=1 Tax=Anabas testudineus TaxID=64144 RepID=A0A3Q1J1M1_ANATE|nr:adhesion G-protein coupled receptor D1 isoform X2 [Anabas testudineus]